MRGHVRERGKGSWAVVIDQGRGADGKRRQKWVTVKGKKSDAEEELTRLLREKDQGVDIDVSKATVGKYLEQWLAAVKPRLSPTSAGWYELVVELHLTPHLGAIPLRKLRAPHVETMYAALLEGRSPATVRGYHAVLRSALAQAVQWGLLGRNPMDAVTPPRVPDKEVAVLSPEQTEHLVKTAEGLRLQVPVIVAVTTGLRVGELLGLRWDDVDGDTLHVRRAVSKLRDGSLLVKEPKTARGRRQVTLPAVAVEALRRHKAAQAAERLRLGPLWEDKNLVFPGQTGRHWPPDALRGSFRYLLRLAGLKLRWHDLRHTHASQLLLSGEQVHVVSKRLGHSNPALTLRVYAHLLPGQERAAAHKVDAMFANGLQVGGAIGRKRRK